LGDNVSNPYDAPAGTGFGGEWLNYVEICAILVCEPYNVPRDQIKHLNRWDLRNIYFRPRDKKTGNLVLSKKPAQPRTQTTNHKEAFFAFWEYVLPKHRIEELYAKEMRAIWPIK
jgi:hypothetical protein